MSFDAERLSNVDPGHRALLDSSLWAPSAHNAQPWQVEPLEDGHSYELHYAQTSDLPEDHGNKDAYLTMGAMVETMVLQGPNHSLNVAVTPRLTRRDEDLHIASVALSRLVESDQIDSLSAWIGRRVTNRNEYRLRAISKT